MAQALAAGTRLGSRLLPGAVLEERYRLEAILGAGSFGVVWQARHVHLETACAVKLFDPPPGADSEDAAARFLQEARLMARLKCPHVAQVFDFGVHERMPFLVLELLHGMTLASRLQLLRAQGRRMSPRQTVHVLQHVAQALSVAHQAQVVHRDLKPDNIFLVEEGDRVTAKVLDFGIAKWSSEALPSLTTTRIVMGTPHYMSPEQFESARQVDHRADLWSLGVIAFECLTGTLPFPGETLIDVAFRVCKQGPLLASELAPVPDGFNGWFARATARGREYRFRSALEQVQALADICGQPAAVALAPEAAAASMSAREPALPATPPSPSILEAETQVTKPRLGASTLALVRQLRPRALAQPFAGRWRWLSAAAGASGISLWILALLCSSDPSTGVERPPQAERAHVQDTRRLEPAPLPEPLEAEQQEPTVKVVRDDAPPAPPLSKPEQRPIPAPAAPPPRPTGVVRDNAESILDRVVREASSCASRGGVWGEGEVRITHPPQGGVGAAELLTEKFRGTETGTCVLRVFRLAELPPFQGAAPRSFTRAFQIQQAKPEPRREETSAPTRSERTKPAAPKSEPTRSLTPLTPAPTPSAERLAQLGATPIDVANAALFEAASVAAARCGSPGGPSGQGRAHVLYDQSGAVQAATILTASFAGTATGECVRRLFQSASIPPFKGQPPSINKSFIIPAQ